MLPLLLLCATNTHTQQQSAQSVTERMSETIESVVHLQCICKQMAPPPLTNRSLSATATTNNHGNIIVHDKHRAELQNWKGRKMSKNDRSLWDSRIGNRKSSTAAAAKLAAAVLMRASLAPLPLRRRSKHSEKKAENERRRLKKKKKWKRNNPRKKEKTRGEIRGKKIGREKEEECVWKASPFPSSSSSSAYLILLYCYINSCAAVLQCKLAWMVQMWREEWKDETESREGEKNNTTQHNRIDPSLFVLQWKRETDTFLIQ